VPFSYIFACDNALVCVDRHSSAASVIKSLVVGRVATPVVRLCEPDCLTIVQRSVNQDTCFTLCCRVIMSCGNERGRTVCLDGEEKLYMACVLASYDVKARYAMRWLHYTEK